MALKHIEKVQMHLHIALTTNCTYMVEDGKLAPLYMVLLAWTVERKNEKSVQSAQKFCPRKNEMKIMTVPLYITLQTPETEKSFQSAQKFCPRKMK